MTNFRFILEYDGTGFEGWQVQGSRRTVQGCLVAALETIVGVPVSLTGSGRTDSGVHAEGQVANARLNTRLDAPALQRALNGNLPDDVAVLAVDVVADAFDARRDANSKHYRYRIWNDPVRSPLRARRAWWIRVPLDLERIRKAAPVLVGRHDFASFQASGSDVQTTVRSLTRADVSGGFGDEVVFDFEGDGFLRYMIRNLVGTLVDVGRGAREVEELFEILERRDRAAAGATAPAHGLTLVSVSYS
ncbi:MAG: tRNA pseudouridine(38-40) synthase TruA [Myxococcota bacterium]|nr:tRNA pseudouridine(38-40) synthase TruA [Myxococcota bacterium]